jgi:hypothetical protein
MSFLSWQITILAATLWAESLLFIAWRLQQQADRERLLRRLNVYGIEGRCLSANRRRAS